MRRTGRSPRNGDGARMECSEQELLGLLPRVLGVAEVAVRRGLAVDRLLEVELLDCKEKAGRRQIRRVRTKMKIQEQTYR